MSELWPPECFLSWEKLNRFLDILDENYGEGIDGWPYILDRRTGSTGRGNVLLINCNDQFAWAYADCEPVTDLDLLEQCYKDCIGLIGEIGYIDAPLLYIARKRGMRPQGCCYPSDERLWHLFDATGPERELNMANPFRPGERQVEYKVPKTQG